MKNFIRPGNSVPVAAPTGGVVSGAPVLVGSLFGIASCDAAEGATVELALVGVFTLAKVSALAVAVGDLLYFDSATGLVNKTASGNKLVGVAVSAAGNPSSTVNVRLNGAAA